MNPKTCSPYPWGTIAKVTLVAACIIAVGVVLYQRNNIVLPPTPQHLKNTDEAFLPALNQVCGETLKNLTVKGKSIISCIDPAWKPEISIDVENSVNKIVCPLYLKPDCYSSLVKQHILGESGEDYEAAQAMLQRNPNSIVAKFPEWFCKGKDWVESLVFWNQRPLLFEEGTFELKVHALMGK